MQGRPGADDLWGKFPDESRSGPAWHPLIDHCTDVACVLEALLHQPTIRRRLARAGELDDLSEVQTARFCFLAFIHDMGKCALGFGAKAAPEFGRAAGHLAALKPLLDGPLAPELQNLLDLPKLHAWAGDALQACWPIMGGYLILNFATDQTSTSSEAGPTGAESLCAGSQT